MELLGFEGFNQTYQWELPLTTIHFSIQMSKTSRARNRGVRLKDLQLRVMAEYCSSGIWAIGKVGCFRHGTIEHSSLKLSPDLAQRFEQWIELYDENSAANFDVDRFNSIGRELAQDLKNYLGNGSVEFIPELVDGGIGETEIF
jgi:hypothetical protein